MAEVIDATGKAGAIYAIARDRKAATLPSEEEPNSPVSPTGIWAKQEWGATEGTLG